MQHDWRYAGLRLKLLGAGIVLVAGCPDPGPDSGADAGPLPRCVSDRDCDDGLFCNGAERCETVEGQPRCQASEPPCLGGQTCSEAEAMCLTQCDVGADADSDGVNALECGGDDCDDADPDRFPGNREICDPFHRDEDCDPSTFGEDADGDGYVDADCCNAQPDGRLQCGEDCDDRSQDINPDAQEICSSRDEDCDGLVDENPIVPYFPDTDGDLRGDDSAEPQLACIPPVGFVSNNADCDDADPAVHGGRVETCDAVDNDCDGLADEGLINCCGNGDVDGFEQCEDGNRMAGDGCDSNCQIEVGWRCDETGCETDCGDGETVGAELCDDGNRFDGDMCSAACDRIGQISVTSGGGCRVFANGAIDCWGEVEDPPVGTYIDVFASSTGPCALREDRSVVCWDEGRTTRNPSGEYIDIAGAFDAACGIRADGSMHCFDGQHSMDPIPNGPFTSIDVGDHLACAIREDQTLACVADDIAAGFPPEVLGEYPPAGTFTQLSFAGTAGCAVGTDGTLSCFGANDGGFILGSPPTGTFEQVECSGLHCCALPANGRPVCWGFGSRGQLSPPEGIFLSIDVAHEVSCGVRQRGDIACWGARTAPEAPPFSQVSLGSAVGCALQSTGRARCWGNWGDHAPPNAFTEIVAGDAISCGIEVDGTLVCWSEDGVLDPLPGSEGRVYETLASDLGARLVCAVRDDGVLQCWSVERQFGSPLGTIVEVSPTTSSRFVEVAVGAFIVCATHDDGIPECWSRDSTPIVLTEWVLTSPPALTGIEGGNSAVCGLDANNHARCVGNLGSARCPIEFSDFELDRVDSGSGQYFCGHSRGDVQCWGCNWPRPIPPGVMTDMSTNGRTSCGIAAAFGDIVCWGASDWGLLEAPAR